MSFHDLFSSGSRRHYRPRARRGVADALAVVEPPQGLSPETAADLEAAHAKIRDAAYAPSTRRAYDRDWKHFCAHCLARTQSPLPADPETVAGYLAWHADHGYKVATIERRFAAIVWHHWRARHPLDTRNVMLHDVRRGIRRVLGTAPTRKTAVTTAAVRTMVQELPDTTLGLRDRVLLLIGFAGAFRRSELVALDLAHLTREPDGITVLVPRSKTDQEGAGRTKFIPYGTDPATCPVRTLDHWLERAGLDRPAQAVEGPTGPVFRAVSRAGRVLARGLSDRAVARVVKQAVAPVAAAQAAREWDELSPDARARAGGAAGAEAWRSVRARSITQTYAGHSLRAGFVTAAKLAGARDDEIMMQTHHRSPESMAAYIRDVTPISESAVAKLGL